MPWAPGTSVCQSCGYGYLQGLAMAPRIIGLPDALALVLVRSGAARPAAPASPTPLRNVRRVTLVGQTVPSGAWSVLDAALTTPPDYAELSEELLRGAGS